MAAIRSIALEFDADPTGPCGAALTPLTLDGAAGRTYDTVKGRIVGIGIPRDAATDTFVEENLADLTAGCPSHTTTLSDGSELTLSAPEAVDISAIAPDGLAWISTVEAPTPGQHRATVLLPAPDLTMIVTMTSPEPVDPALIEAIATVWTEAAAASARLGVGYRRRIRHRPMRLPASTSRSIVATNRKRARRAACRRSRRSRCRAC